MADHVSKIFEEGGNSDKDRHHRDDHGTSFWYKGIVRDD